MSKWLNKTIITELTSLPDEKEMIWLKSIDKPCKILGYCPYGSLVEEFPFHDPRHERYSCKLFGHNCPVFYQAENVRGFEYQTTEDPLRRSHDI